MKKIYLLPLLLLTTLAGCSSNSNPSNGMINDFESYQELSLMKFPSKSHADRAKIELSDQCVTHGNKSMKLTNYFGTSFEMHHFFTNTSSGKMDGANIKSINIDVYNDSLFDTTAKIIIYNNESLDILLEKEFDIIKDEFNHLSFELSKIALDNNKDTLISSSLLLYTPETDYDNKVGYTFYIDNWHAEIGSEMTEEDITYKEIVDKVKADIDALPETSNIQLSDYDRLNEVALAIDKIPGLYKRIVPNINDFNAKTAAFYALKKATNTPTGKHDTFIPTTEFYGTSSIYTHLNTKASIFFSDAWKDEEAVVGSTKIEFSGSVHSYFKFDPLVNLQGYDFMFSTIHNETGHYVRIWFSYFNNIYVDVHDGETITFKVGAREIAGQEFFVIDQLKSPNDGTIVPASGTLFFGTTYLTGGSIEEKIALMQYAFDNLPTIDELGDDEDKHVDNMCFMTTARTLYNELGQYLDDVVTSTQIELLETLESHYRSAGYVSLQNGYDSGFTKYFYGSEVEPIKGVKNERFGFVSGFRINNDPTNVDGTIIEQAVTYSTEPNVAPSSNGYVVSIYNPTNNPANVIIRNTEWNWEIYDPFYTRAVLQPKAWTKLEINPTVLSSDASPDGRIAIFLNALNEGGNTLVGDWLVSSLIGIPRTI